MGQAHSRNERPGGFWRRRKPEATAQQPPPESSSRMASPPPKPYQPSSIKMENSSAHGSMSPTTANTTPGSATPFADMLGDAMTDTSADKADKADKADQPGQVEIEITVQQASSPSDQSMPDASDKSDQSSQPDQPVQPVQPVQPSQSDQAFKSAWQLPPSRPALKREFTPPHRIKIWSMAAWKNERAYSNLYDHVTRTLNQIRNQQVSSRRMAPVDKAMQLAIYKACDSCTLSLEYLVGHFSTRFFHYEGPESILSMMATIEADASRLDDLRQKQRHLSNYGYTLEQKVIQTEAHIRELAELAKRIKEAGPAEAADEEAEEDEDEDMDAEWDADPEYGGKANGNGNHA